MRYRLVYFEDRVITGEELKVRLANEGWTVPTIPGAVWVKPAPPAIPSPGRNMDEAMQWAQYEVLFAKSRAQYYADLAARTEALLKFELALQNKFYIATYVVVNKVQGRNVYGWKVVSNTAYTYKQFASLLTKASDPLEKLCNQYGG